MSGKKISKTKFSFRYPLAKSSLPIFTVHCSCRLVNVDPCKAVTRTVIRQECTFIYLCFAWQISFQIDRIEINVKSYSIDSPLVSQNL